MIATARCARVSYDNFDGSDDYDKDIQLYDRLSSMGHYSPFEHTAKAMNEDEYIYCKRTTLLNNKYREQKGWLGNFQGFIQLRKTLENENKSDIRVIKK